LETQPDGAVPVGIRFSYPCLPVVGSKLISKLNEYWYIAAYSSELRTRPLSQTVLGTPLVLFRDTKGAEVHQIPFFPRLLKGILKISLRDWRLGASGRISSERKKLEINSHASESKNLEEETHKWQR
jgi:hypothetical protein